jgi:hypothetical protein
MEIITPSQFGDAMQFLQSQQESTRNKINQGIRITACATLLLLAACGGGGGGGEANSTTAAIEPIPNTEPPATITISGVVAKGITLAGASVVVNNASGVIGTKTTVGTDGRYSVNLPANTQMPIVLTASKVLLTGETENYSTVVADKANTTANITPITNVIAALLSSSGNPDQLPSQLAAGASISQATLNTKTVAIQNTLKTVLDALGVSGVDPIKGSFALNGSAYQKLLESISTDITPTGTNSNIEIALKTKPTSVSAQPLVAKFTSNQETPQALGAVSAKDFVADGISLKLTQLMVDAQACYALPLRTRVATATIPDPLKPDETIGTAIDVTAPLCKGIFMGNNPALYKNSGALIGRNNVNLVAFATLFTAAGNGLSFENPEHQYTLANGDLGFSYRTTRTNGEYTYAVSIVRLDSADQKLKFIGDQYSYNGRVTTFMQSREYPLLNQSQWSHISTGYIINVENTIKADNTNLFSKVEVVAPGGEIYTLVPTGNSTFLRFQGQGRSNFLRLRSAFKDLTKPRSDLDKLTSEKNVSAFANPEYTDLAIAAIPSQSTWTFRYFLEGSVGATPDATQVYRTVGRAQTIAELQAKQFASVTSATLTNWATNVIPLTGQLGLTTSAPFSLSWTVPNTALLPINATLSGTYLTDVDVGVNTSRSNFFARADFLAGTTAAAAINCTSLVNEDVFYCRGATNGGFKLGSEANGLNLVGIDSQARNVATFYAFNRLEIAP